MDVNQFNIVKCVACTVLEEVPRSWVGFPLGMIAHQRRGLSLAYIKDLLRPLLEPSAMKGLSLETCPCGWEL